MKKSFDMMETFFFLSNLLNGTNTTGKRFAPQNVPQTVKLSFLRGFDAFSPEIDKKKFSLRFKK